MIPAEKTNIVAADTLILVVDDEEFIRRMVSRNLHEQGYGYGFSCVMAESGAAALVELAARPFSLIITDLMMPGMTGLELLTAAKQMQPDIAVVMLTGVDSSATAVEALAQGAYGYVIKPFQPNELLINVINALRRRDLEILRSSYERQLEHEVSERTRDIHEREEEITLRLVSASEYRDNETGSHIRRMAQYAALLARELGWAADQVELMRLAAPMHDIGKIGIPDSILLKPGKLTPEEEQLMQQHTIIGTRILEGSVCSLLQMAYTVALNHHERWDGSGYPRRLVGEAIPECARIVAIADVYDALHSDRIYRRAFSETAALELLIASKAQFDPRLFACLLDNVDELRRIRCQFSEV